MGPPWLVFICVGGCVWQMLYEGATTQTLAATFPRIFGGGQKARIAGNANFDDFAATQRTALAARAEAEGLSVGAMDDILTAAYSAAHAGAG